MARLLRIFRWAEIVLGILLTIRVLMSGNSDWGVLYILMLFIVINAPMFFVGLWAVVFRPEVRKLAATVALLPIGFLIVPMMIRSVVGQALSPRFFLGIAVVTVAALLTWAIVRPRSASTWMPSSLLRGKWLNATVLALPIIGWLLPVVAYLVLAAIGESSSGRGTSPGMGTAVLLIFAALYLVGLGAVSLLATVWGWVGFRSAAAGERLSVNTWQMFVGLPGIAAGVLAAMWVGSQ